jgi:hypothetical protein
MTSKNPIPSAQMPAANEAKLDSRYGRIGISAVAAALHYSSEAKNPAYAPVAPRPDKFIEAMIEMAA